MKELIKKAKQDARDQAYSEACGFNTLEQYKATAKLEAYITALYGDAYIFGSEVVLNPDQRKQHFHWIGSTQFGKSKHFEHCIRQDLDRGTPVVLIDPDGNFYRDVLRFCALKNYRKIVVIDPAPEGNNPHYVSFNPLKKRPDETYQSCAGRVTDGVITAWHETLDKLPSFQKYVPAILQILSRTNMTMAEFPDFLYRQGTPLRMRIFDDAFAQVAREGDSLSPIRTITELYVGGPMYTSKELLSAGNRLLNFVTNPNILNILGQGDNTISIPDLLDDGFSILVNLNPSKWPDTIHLPLILGTLVLNEVMIAEPVKPVHVYIDEVGYFATEKLKTFLSLKLKRNLVLHLAHQYLAQLKSLDIGKAISNCCVNKIVFKIPDSEDVTTIAKTIFGRADQELTDLLRQLKRQFAVMAIIDEEPKLAQVPTVSSLPDVNLDDYLHSLYDEYKDWYSTADEARRRLEFRQFPGPRPVEPPPEQPPSDQPIVNRPTLIFGRKI